MARGRKRTEAEKSNAEMLLEAQNVDIIMPETKAKDIAKGTVKEKEIPEPPVGYVVLTKAASVFSHGIHFDKGVPVKIDNPELYNYLMASGLFV